MTTLPPIRFRDSYARAFEREVLSYLEDVLLKPLGDVRENSVTTDPLLRAIAEGSVGHDGTKWTGSFSIPISKRIRDLGGFNTPISTLPREIREALADAQQHFSAYKAAVLGVLTTVGANVATVREPVDPVVVQAVIDDAVAATEGEIPTNLAAPIAEELAQARQDVVLQGVGRIRSQLERAKNVAELKTAIAVATVAIKRRAAMVAEQKASETIAATQAAVALANGVEEYVWVTVGDGRVRHDHKLLDNRIFRFDTPPVVDIATGRRANPGEDYNCRCFARPVIR